MFVCAWCEHWHNAIDNGSNIGCGKECGGPVVGKGFPLYKGPIDLSKYCFICGNDATSCVRIGGKLIGVCNKIGSGNITCLDRLRKILSGQKNIVVRERVVPVIG